MTEVIMRRAWSRATASPGCQETWSSDNPAWGQCGVTVAVLWKDLKENDGVICEVLRADVEVFGSHYWLRLPDGTEIDMTRSQFPEGTMIPEGEVRTIEYLLDSERARSARTRERADLLERTLNDIAETWVLGLFDRAASSLADEKGAGPKTLNGLLEKLEEDVEEIERTAASITKDMEEGEGGAAR